ncbi:MAG: PASTA domain-containing protein [Actinomycetota bacterium]|nr:PASTA domain-containing protein [Actinomycetota bacterium]
MDEATPIKVWIRPGTLEEPGKISSAAPGIINLPWDQANHLLVFHGFNNIDYIYERNDSVPPNHVYRQEPSAGQPANSNQTIRVWVNP